MTPDDENELDFKNDDVKSKEGEAEGEDGLEGGGGGGELQAYAAMSSSESVSWSLLIPLLP